MLLIEPSPINLNGFLKETKISSRRGLTIKGYVIDNVENKPDKRRGDSVQYLICLKIF
jgi:hypothetical protein